MKFTRPRLQNSKLPEAAKYKWAVNVLSEGFVPFPKKLLRTMTALFQGDVGVEELNVILAIVDFKRPGNKSDLSVEYLAFLAGLNPSRVPSILDRLVQRGLITVEQDAIGRLNIDYPGLISAIEKIAELRDREDRELPEEDPSF